MVVFAICIFIGGYVAYRMGRKADPLMKFFAILFGICAGFLVGTIAVAIFLATVPNTVHKYEFEKVELVTLVDSSELQGSFFLASGSLGAEQHYKFYYKTSDGGKKFGKVNAESVTVYEEDRKNAYMAKSGEENRYSQRVYLWLIPKFLSGGNSWKYTIHIPKGTIKEEYNLDLK